MGFIIDDLFMAPINLVTWLGEKVKEAADAELFDEGKLRTELGELQMKLEMEEISEEDYQEKENVIIARLNYIKTLKEGEEKE